jgi:hypothetical protein
VRAGRDEEAPSNSPRELNIRRSASVLIGVSMMYRHSASSAKGGSLLTVDLHPIFRDESAIARTLRESLFKAKATGIPVIEIIPGKGSGTLKKRVLAFLEQKHIKKLYARVETDASNSGHLYVHMN